MVVVVSMRCPTDLMTGMSCPEEATRDCPSKGEGHRSPDRWGRMTSHRTSGSWGHSAGD